MALNAPLDPPVTMMTRTAQNGDLFNSRWRLVQFTVATPKAHVSYVSRDRQITVATLAAPILFFSKYTAIHQQATRSAPPANPATHRTIR